MYPVVEKDRLSMRYYLWEMRPYFRQVAGQLVLGSIAGILMNTAVVLPAILLGRAIDTARAFEWGEVGPGALGCAALAGLERIFQVLALPSEASAPESTRRPQYRGNAAIEMRQVFFGYLPNRPVLRGVSLAAQPGEHIVLVGRTGAGKS